MKMGMPTNEPGLFEVPGGFTILVKVKLGSVTRWKRKSLPGATRAEALLEMKKLRAVATTEAEAKDNKEDPHRALSVFARRWDDDLRRRVDEGEITPATRSTHVHNLDKFVLPFIGKMMVDDIKPKTIVDWMRWIPDLQMEETRIGRGKKSYAQEPKRYAKPTLQSAWRTLRSFMKWITIETDLPRNPAAEVRWSMKGAPPAKKKATLNQAEVVRLLEAAEAEEDRSIRIMIMVALAGALRASELSALEWGAVDFVAGTIEIVRSHVRGKIGAPKTEGSRRTVMLPLGLVEELRRYKAWQVRRADEKRARFESRGQPDTTRPNTLVFPSATGTLMQPGSINYLLERCAKRAGIDKHVTSHAMRRTTNNLLRRTAGELVARKVTGHVTQQMTAHYSEVDHEERVTALHDAFGTALLSPSMNDESSSSPTEVQPALVDGA